MRRFFLGPFLDALAGLEACLDRGRERALVVVFLGLLVGYWIYVPLHELGHAFACMTTGGEVTRLEISPLYGGALLERVFPWVASGGEYAGRLSGFDPRGSDGTYLATDLGPFLLTLFPGVWALRRAGTAARPLLFGFALPYALAPFLSLTGDAYEIGSILTSWLPPWSGTETRALLVGDDVLKKISELRSLGSAPWGGLVLSTVLGALWALATYALGGWIANGLGARPRRESDDARA